jgi:hypothetical protein
MVLPGSVTQRRTRCGRRNCGCHADPPRLHGPYWQWTRKIAAKTICRWLSDGQHRDYTAWIDNDRRLRELLARLEALGAAAFDADPRWERRASRRPAEPEPKSPDNVGSARLTCGQPSSQPLFPQVIPKREDLSQVREGKCLISVSARGTNDTGRICACCHAKGQARPALVSDRRGPPRAAPTWGCT